MSTTPTLWQRHRIAGLLLALVPGLLWRLHLLTYQPIPLVMPAITYHTEAGYHYAQDSAGNSISMPNRTPAAERAAARQLGASGRDSRFATVQAGYRKGQRPTH